MMLTDVHRVMHMTTGKSSFILQSQKNEDVLERVLVLHNDCHI